ncbi:hypothetical protein HZ994_12005 [Akkermansiaceae bacterium]|nr:hypothetical protein HZ994_12005 [Akkermansiaceae bacterium]
MSFRDWLPITPRNRIALCLALASLVMFVAWNCLPYYEMEGVPSEGIVATAAWPEFFSPDNYVYVFQSPDIEGFLNVTASLGLILGGLVVLLTVPLWQILHASNYIRLPLAVLNLLGGAVISWHLFDSAMDDPAPYWIITIALMALSLFGVSAAFFLFRNELALRNARASGMR